MNALRQIGRDWPLMNAADRTRIALAFGFIFGALSHIGWVIAHGDFWYHGPGPSWAPAFWYGLCLVDPIVFWMLAAQPRLGIVLGSITMAVSLAVNWLCFPTFEFQFNYVLIGLTLFGVVMWLTSPWLWARSKWRLSSSSARNGG